MSSSGCDCQSQKWQKYPNLPVTALHSCALWVARHCRGMSCSKWCQIPTLVVMILFQEIKCGTTCHLRFIFGWVKKHKPYEVMHHKLILMTTFALLHMRLITPELFKGRSALIAAHWWSLRNGVCLMQHKSSGHVLLVFTRKAENSFILFCSGCAWPGTRSAPWCASPPRIFFCFWSMAILVLQGET